MLDKVRKDRFTGKTIDRALPRRISEKIMFRVIDRGRRKRSDEVKNWVRASAIESLGEYAPGVQVSKEFTWSSYWRRHGFQEPCGILAGKISIDITIYGQMHK